MKIKRSIIKATMLSVCLVGSVCLNGCDTLLDVAGTAAKSSSSFQGGNSVGTAKALKSQADSAAKDWDSGAALVKVEGVNIDLSGENELAGSQWKFLYANADKSKSYEIIFSSSGMTKQEQGSTSLETIPSFEYDSGDAIPRARDELSISPADVKKLNMTLTSSGGQVSWKVDFLNDLGQTASSTNVSTSA